MFKILDKNLESLKAIVYDTVRKIGTDSFIELFFYIPSDQTVQVDLYNKMGRFIKNVTSKKYFHGHNRIVFPMDIIPAGFPSGPYYYLHFRTPSSPDINKSVLVVLTR